MLLHSPLYIVIISGDHFLRNGFCIQGFGMQQLFELKITCTDLLQLFRTFNDFVTVRRRTVRHETLSKVDFFFITYESQSCLERMKTEDWAQIYVFVLGRIFQQ